MYAPDFLMPNLKKVSKNYYKGIKINIEDILFLAKEGTSVVWEVPGKYDKVLPAAFVQNWTLKQLSKYNFYLPISKKEFQRIANNLSMNVELKNELKKHNII